ncbi:MULTISPECIES: ATP-dependent DNA ligase [Methanobacterium]|jgi:DNA ligase-1|uniref:ATP-dependent DNA ligase n=1 Tax=Methanobacterium formicicum TaxID=2162 RepID=A0A089ZGU5_METFO|nr:MULTISPECIES: ATP-dependent DNA ligase [Methanobacterium]AIS32400.1 DNA ligase LigD [Methanobacterium formicicum]KUK74844.1 MAG: ATP dependent DNA ligase [Methanobacterium sp. 42_16]MBF4474167.1 ATP-dependent DNA ligase [Methanobacterium formicicum]MDG3546313.1 ATP-dependent DNA ligase [Methanobacterium formicicum]
MEMLEPMLSKLAEEDVHLEGVWVSEPKLDGERIIALRKGDQIDLWTRRHVEVSYKFPEIISSLKKNIKGDNWILDGELTVPGGFRKLLKRNVEDRFKISLLAKKLPATLNLFDILRFQGEDLTSKALVQRKKILLKVVQEGGHIKIVPFKTVNSKKIKDHFVESIHRGYEGLILKNASSEYESGKRSSHWLKIKRSETIDVNVIGATKSTGSIAFGALILEKDGQYFGKVGTGFSDLDRKEILEFLEKNRGVTDIPLPADLDILLTTRQLPAEIKANEIVKGKPRAPVWVRFRWA